MLPFQGALQKADRFFSLGTSSENSVEKKKSLVFRQLVQFISFLQSVGKAAAVAKGPTLSSCPSSREAREPPGAAGRLCQPKPVLLAFTRLRGNSPAPVSPAEKQTASAAGLHVISIYLQEVPRHTTQYRMAEITENFPRSSTVRALTQ